MILQFTRIVPKCHFFVKTHWFSGWCRARQLVNTPRLLWDFRSLRGPQLLFFGFSGTLSQISQV